MPKDLVSVLMPVYNAEQTLSKSIESILDQSYRNIEFVIIDDGSSDDTWGIIDKYSKVDKRIIAKKNKNQGLTKSLNEGIEICSGKYIARQDSDDISLRNRLEKQYSVAESTGSDLVVSQAYEVCNQSVKIVPNAQLLSNLTFSSTRFGNYFIHGTFFMKTSTLKEFRYDEKYRYSQDFELILRLFANNKKIIPIIDPIYVFNKVKNSISNRKKKEQIDFAKDIVKKYHGTSIFLFSNKPIYLKLLIYLFYKWKK